MSERFVYKYVVVLGIDGMGNFNRFASTPGMDLIFKKGAYTYDALSMDPTISAENWGAMLLGANPTVHGLTNSIVGRYEYTNKNLPSVFARIRAELPQAYLASCCNWNPINIGIIEHDIGVDFYTADNDTELTPLILQAVERKPTFMFIQFDEVDGAGHKFSYGEKEYLEKISDTDALAAEVYQAYKAAGIIDETLFIVIADHGGVRCGHGGYTDTEKYVFLGAAGKSVTPGIIGTAFTKDIAATVLYALGLDVPSYNAAAFSSQVPYGIFNGVGDNYYSPAAKETVVVAKETPQLDASDGLAAFLPKDKIKLALFFDDSLTDSAYGHTAREHGCVKYYSDGVRGSYGELGKTGSAVFDGIKVGDGSFSLALWLKIDRSIDEEPAICANKDWWWQNRRGKGFALSLRCADTVFNCGCGDDDFDFITPFPEDISEGWIHTIISVDKEAKEVRCYYNFRLVHSMKLEDNFLGNFDGLPFTVGDDGMGTYNSITHNFLIHIDDFLLLDKLTDTEISSLAKYYDM